LKNWYQKAFKRSVIDMHIEDWDPVFLSRFDPKEYVAALKLACADSAVVYAHSHVGHSLYPTKIGHPHACLKGRDLFREITDACHAQGIAVVAYYSLVFNNWAYHTHPDWRIINHGGRDAGQGERYGVCCPNSPYAEFVLREVQELCSGYDFEGIRFDMTFWPTVCFCPYCHKKFMNEAKQAIPDEVDWNHPVWTRFQRCREQWMIDFARRVTETARRNKPSVTVEHQASTFPLGWQFGIAAGLRDCNDFLQGDFYGGYIQQSFVCKLLNNLTLKKPIGYETSLATHIGANYYKTPDYLMAQICGAMANHAAFVFIDSIDPTGTLNPNIYKMIGKLFEQTAVYETYLGGQIMADVAVYLSTESKCQVETETAHPKTVTMNSNCDVFPHSGNVLNTAKAMVNHNILFDIITQKNLDRLGAYKLVILPNAAMMTPQEAEAFREYVRGGGKLYASKWTSLYDSHQGILPNFMLADVFGADYRGKTDKKITFILPCEGTDVFGGIYNAVYPVGIEGTQLMLSAHRSAQVMGHTVLPYTDRNDKEQFASIHCNPPAAITDNPAMISNVYGKGCCIYVNCELENEKDHETLFVNIIKSLAGDKLRLTSNAPKCVEITVFDQPENKRLIVSLINFQSELPNLPVYDIAVNLRMDKTIVEVHTAADNKPLPFTMKDNRCAFKIPRLDTFSMLSLNYR